MFGGKAGEMGARAIKIMTWLVTLIKILPISLGKLVAKRMMPVSPDDEIIPWIKSKKRANKDFLRSMMNAADSPDPPFSLQVAEKITAPTLLIIGDREKGSIVSLEVAQEMGKLIPDFQVAHLKGANHDIRRSKFDEYMHAVRKFLDEAYQ